VEKVTEERPRIDITTTEFELNHMDRTVVEKPACTSDDIEFTTFHIKLQEINTVNPLVSADVFEPSDLDILVCDKLRLAMLEVPLEQRADR
jgi:hypothetical protein